MDFELDPEVSCSCGSDAGLASTALECVYCEEPICEECDDLFHSHCEECYEELFNERSEGYD